MCIHFYVLIPNSCNTLTKLYSQYCQPHQAICKSHFLLKVFPSELSNLDCLMSRPSAQLVSGSFPLLSPWEIPAVLFCIRSCFLDHMSSFFSRFITLILLDIYSKIPNLACLKMFIFYPGNWLVVWLGIEFKVENHSLFSVKGTSPVSSSFQYCC